MHVVFIRHGESTGNVGIPCPDVSRVELTELGRQQARQLAESWVDAPALIVVSPFVRTRQTAQPTRDRFPTVPVQEWAIEEFTYLEPGRWNGTAYSERLPSIEAYWKAADPEYRDGPGAENFATLLRRAEVALERLRGFADHVNMDLPPVLRQTVKTQNPMNGELSHGFVTQAVHQRIQAGRSSAAGSRGIAG